MIRDAPLASNRRNATAVMRAELIDTNPKVPVPASRWAMYSRSAPTKYPSSPATTAGQSTSRSWPVLSSWMRPC
jgi:hypothetical protein